MTTAKKPTAKKVSAAPTASTSFPNFEADFKDLCMRALTTMRTGQGTDSLYLLRGYVEHYAKMLENHPPKDSHSRRRIDKAREELESISDRLPNFDLHREYKQLYEAGKPSTAAFTRYWKAETARKAAKAGMTVRAYAAHQKAAQAAYELEHKTRVAALQAIRNARAKVDPEAPRNAAPAKKALAKRATKA